MTEQSVQALIESHLARYPEMQLTDVYKLLHQMVFGSSHAIAKKKSAQEWLEHEWDANPANPDESLLESVSTDGSLVRLHLRPYKACDGQMKPLLEAVIRSRNAVRGDAAGMAAAWDSFAAMVNDDPELAERFPPREVRLFGRVSAARDWAVSPHSPEYIRAYRPAYRILTLEDARTVCEKQRISL